MIPFAESLLAIAAALVVPAFVGLLVVAGLASSVRFRYLAAFSLGVFFWFFSDTAGGSSYLDVNAGFTGGMEQLALLTLFAAGLLIVFSLDRTAFSPGPAVTGLGFSIPLLVAFAVGFHGLGEGAAFSATAAATQNSNLVDAFGGVSAAVAFVLHKGLEPVMISAAYWAYAKDHAKNLTGLLKDLSLLTLVFALPGIVGGAANYFLSYDTTYFFAFGLGTSVYAAVMLAKPLFWDSNVSGYDSAKLAIIVLLGFLSMYSAALFHA